MSETDTLEPDVIHSRIEDRVWMTLARRISRFPLAGIADTKRQVNYIALPAPDALAEDSRLFLEKMRSPVGQPRLTMLFQRGPSAQLGSGILGRPAKCIAVST